jgi:amidase
MSADTITDLDAVALAAAIRRRAVSCVEVMAAYLDRIARLNPRINAIVSLRDRDVLLAEAGERDAQLARGDAVGPLHGFPHAVKDVVPTAGIRTSFGSAIYRDFVPAQDAIVVQRLKRAGAIVIGKTNVPEFGLGSHTFNEVFGATHNPYDPSRSAGGSSGGAAAALASRLVPLADGSDYAGSLRNPAAWNNVFSLRTSPGLVPRDAPDLFFPAPTVIGPMARTVPDLALLLSVLAGPDPAGPSSLPGDPHEFAAPRDADLTGLRVAWCGDFGGHLPFEPGILALCETAARAFGELGCVVEAAAPNFPLDRLWRDWLTLRSWHNASSYAPLYRDPAKRALLKEEMIWEIECGLALSGEDVAQASQGRSDWYRAMARFFASYDVLLLPSVQLFPFPVEWRWPREIAGRAMDSYHRWMENNIVITMSGCPALNVPVGFDARGLPMGMQIVAPIGGDRRLLELAQAYDRATGWSARQPPLASGG